MFRKSSLLAVCLCFMASPLALADSNVQVETKNTLTTTRPHHEVNMEKGTCYKEKDGRGEVIKWADRESKCREGGQSWVTVGGDITNFDHDH